MTHARRVAVVAVALTAVCCAGCGSSAHHASTTTVTDRLNGSTVTLHVGEDLRVVLASTYWTFDSVSNPAVVDTDGPPQAHPQMQGCVPGQGCGTQTARYTAAKVGTATVNASRSSCGEALRCTNGHGRFTLRVIVK